MKKIKLSTKAVLSLGLSAVLFCMPAVGFALNGNYAVNVHAEDSKEQEAVSEEPAESTGQTEADTEQSAEGGTEESTENTTEESTENGTVSGNEVTEPVCTCEKKCSAYDYDKDCEVCAADYRDCEYKTPNVVININSPGGWYNERATVTFTVSDTAHTGNFEIAMIQAKVGQNGSWTDVTEDKKLEISENCTVYVQVTDQKGNTYERNRAMKCFDTTKPTLNAAVSDGLLSIQVHDTDSGAKAVYVNGYEFTDLTNGTLNIRLQQFDAGYEYFTISAMDNAGNMSEVYKTKNPYYKDPADESDENPAEQLPVNAEATKPGSATGTVTEHTKTDSDGNTIWENALTLVAKGEYSMQEFMGGIEDMVRDLVQTYHSVSEEQKSMFGGGAQGINAGTALGKCPKCGGDVVKGKFGAYCKNKCGMNVGRAMGAVLSDSQIKSMLEGKKTLVKGLKGKKGTYDAYLIPEGIEDYSYTKDGKEIRGSQYKVRLEFPKRKK